MACYHSKVGAVELLLNHLVDGPGEYVVVDMTAGADSFASGTVHPLRPDLPGLRADPAQRRRLPAVPRLRPGLRRAGRRDRQQDRRRRRRRVPARARRRRPADLVRPLRLRQSRRTRPRLPRRRARTRQPRRPATPPANGRRRGKDWPRFTRQAAEFHRKAALPGPTTAPARTWPTRSTRTSSSERTCSERRPSGTSRAPHSGVRRPLDGSCIGDSSASTSRQRRVTGAEHNEPIRTERRTHVP